MATPEELQAAEAAEAERRRVEAALPVYTTLGQGSHLGGGTWGMSGPNQFQEDYLGRALPGYSFLDDSPDEGGGAFWRGPDYEAFPSSTSDSFDPRQGMQERTDAAVRAALAGATQEDVDSYWDQQRLQAAINAYSAPWLGEWAVPIAVDLTDASRRMLENPQDRAAIADYYRLNAMLPASPKSSMFQTIGHGLQNLATNPVVMAAVTGGLSVPGLDGAALLTPVQAAATTGAIAGAGASENPFTGALRGGAIGGLTAGAGQYAGEAAAGMFPESPWVAGLARGAAAGGTGAALTGGDVLPASVMGGIMGGVSAFGQPSQSDIDFDQIMGEVNAMMMAEVPGVQPETPVQNLMYTSAGDTAGVGGMLPMGPTYTPALMTTPEQFLAGELAPMAAAPLTPLNPSMEYDPMAALLSAPQIAGVEEEAPTPSEPVPTEGEPDPTESAINKEGLVKFAKKAIDILSQAMGDRAAPEFVLPEQEEGQSDADYLAEISDLALGYLGLDADAMKDAGYEAGTQEYLDYILAQADKVIDAAYKGASVEEMEGKSVEEIQQAFRDLSAKEQQALARALHVRGALGTKSFKESAIDPFTGELEYLGGDGAIETAPAATQRGYARFLEETARQTAPEARRSIKGMLGRDVDLFDLGAAKRERTLQDMLDEFNASQPVEDEEEDLYERRGGSRRATRGRGMLPASRFWDSFRR